MEVILNVVSEFNYILDTVNFLSSEIRPYYFFSLYYFSSSLQADDGVLIDVSSY